MDNAEFRYMGQEGFESDSDYRAAIGISNADNTTTRPIYIRGSSFHDLYAGAIAVIGSKDIEISNNVIHHTVGTCRYFLLRLLGSSTCFWWLTFSCCLRLKLMPQAKQWAYLPTICCIKRYNKR